MITDGTERIGLDWNGMGGVGGITTLQPEAEISAWRFAWVFFWFKWVWVWVWAREV